MDEIIEGNSIYGKNADERVRRRQNLFIYKVNEHNYNYRNTDNKGPKRKQRL